MTLSFSFILIFLSIFFIVLSNAAAYNDYKVFCYYDSRGFFRTGSGKVTLEDVEPALAQCTHLVYGYAGISYLDYKIKPLNMDLDIIGNENYYSKVTDFKRTNSHLKVLLSIGGGADLDGAGKYLKILETEETRNNFIDSTLIAINYYGFDGVDLAWEFPPNKGKKPRKTLSSIWHKFKKTVKGEKLVDVDHKKHMEQFTQLVQTMKIKFAAHNKIIAASVLPNVKSSLFFDFLSLSSDLDFIILHAFDFYTPDRNQKEADYSIPLKKVGNRYSELNIDFVVMEWISNFQAYKKIILALPTFGRIWRVKYNEDNLMGKPPLEAAGPADKGLRSYPEICNSFVTNPPTDGRYFYNHLDDYISGPYAFNPPYSNSRGFGEWISYEDPEDIAHKMSYVKEKDLGGVAIVDLTLDDIHGNCTGQKFPLLKTASWNLREI